MTLDEFLNNAHSLGLKINRKSVAKRAYIEYWVFSFGKYLSVKRINDHIKKDHPFKAEFLNGLLKIIDENFEKTGPLKKLYQTLVTRKN